MKQFFDVFLKDSTNFEYILFSNPSGSTTPVVILDDGWAPNITKYVRDGEKTWDDVVEELECMTNVATRDTALALIEKLNALIHRAARDIKEKQAYTVTFNVCSQFSTAPNSAFTYVLSPPDDGNVIILSTDIQAAPPGQVKFKLRFKRTGAWITSFNDTTHSSSFINNDSIQPGFWKLQTTLPTTITTPTPISLAFSFVANGSYDVSVEQLFICFNVLNMYLVKDFGHDEPFNMFAITYPSWWLAYGNYGYSILDNTDSYTIDIRPSTFINLQPGTYAVFVSWRSGQANVAHRLQIQFDNNAETRNTLLLAADTNPHYQFFGTVTMTTPSNIMYLRTTIGHSTGFEIEKILLIQLKTTSTIINLSDWKFFRNATVTVNNNILRPVKNTVQRWTFNNVQFQRVLLTYDNLDIVTDNQSFTTIIVGNSPNVFSLRTEIDYQRVTALPATITYRPIRTTFH